MKSLGLGFKACRRSQKCNRCARYKVFNLFPDRQFSKKSLCISESCWLKTLHQIPSFTWRALLRCHCSNHQAFPMVESCWKLEKGEAMAAPLPQNPPCMWCWDPVKPRDHFPFEPLGTRKPFQKLSGSFLRNLEFRFIHWRMWAITFIFISRSPKERPTSHSFELWLRPFVWPLRGIPDGKSLLWKGSFGITAHFPEWFAGAKVF